MCAKQQAQITLALVLVIVLCAFSFTPRHITQANPVSTSIPFYGNGLVLGPAEQLPTLRKHVPLKVRIYKWLARRGDTQYVPGLWRESNCSLSARWVDLADQSIVLTTPAYAQTLREFAGLGSGGGTFPNGCTDAVAGRAAREIAGGRLPNGTYFGAGPDFNTDGSLTLYRSNGTTVTSQATLTVVPDNSNQYLGQLETGDFDGNGTPDIVVAIGGYTNVSTARIAFLAGDGVGGFAAPVFSTVVAGSGSSAQVSGFTVADFDQDGELDIVATADAGSGASGVVFMHGSGNGTFAANLLSSTPGYGVIGLDIDGNNTLDLATFNGDILFGNGSGGFTLAPGQRFTYGSLASADFDSDGDVDLAITSDGTDSSLVRVWLGDGSGQFTRMDQAYPLVYGSMSADMTISDLDGDAQPDLLMGGAGDGRFGPGINTQGQTQVLLGRGDGRFASPPGFERAVRVAADFDSDGNDDLLAVDTTNGVQILAGPSFAAGTISPIGVTMSIERPVFATRDLSGDGKLDLVVVETSTSSPALHVRAGNGLGGFAASGQDLVLAFVPQDYARGNASTPALADFNADGQPDLAIIGRAGSTTSLYRFNGQAGGTFAAPTIIGTAMHAGEYDSSTVAAADFDGDGDADLALADAGDTFASPTVPGGVGVLLSTGSGFAAMVPLPGPSFPDGLAVGDVNGDNHADIVASGSPGSRLYVFLGNGNGTFAAPLTSDLPDIWFRSIAIGDVDSDGVADLVLGNCCGLTFGWFAKGTGAGQFATPISIPLVVSPAGLALADFNGDDHADLYAQSDGFNSYISVHMNAWRDEIFANGFESP